MAINQFIPFKRDGYTLIEVLIVITMLGIIMPAVFSILYVILQQQAKITEMTEVKRQGDYIMQFMKEKISREAAGIMSDPDGLAGPTPATNVCNSSSPQFSSSAGTTFVFDGGAAFDDFQFSQDLNARINYQQGLVQSALNDTRVRVENVQIACAWKSSYSSPMIAFSYEVTYNRPTVDNELGITKMYYRSRVKLRTGDSD